MKQLETAYAPAYPAVIRALAAPFLNDKAWTDAFEASGVAAPLGPQDGAREAAREACRDVAREVARDGPGELWPPGRGRSSWLPATRLAGGFGERVTPWLRLWRFTLEAHRARHSQAGKSHRAGTLETSRRGRSKGRNRKSLAACSPGPFEGRIAVVEAVLGCIEVLFEQPHVATHEVE